MAKTQKKKILNARQFLRQVHELVEYISTSSNNLLQNENFFAKKILRKKKGNEFITRIIKDTIA